MGRVQTLFSEARGMTELACRIQRFQDMVQDRGLTCAIVSVPHDVTYLTGYRSYWEDGPAMLAMAPGEKPIVVIPSALLCPFPSLDEVDVRPYENYPGQSEGSGYLNLARQVVDVLRRWRVRGAMIGVEIEHVPHFLIEFLQLKIADLEVADITSLLQEQRLVKSNAEVDALCESARVASVGQEAARCALVEGRSEIEVAADARRAMEVEVGEIVEVSLDVVCAARTSVDSIGGLPSGNVCGKGGVLVCDIAPRVDGYWGDSCSVLSVGDPPAGICDMHGVLREAMVLGLEAASPGVLASELDGVIRDHVRHAGFECYQHSGHGLGVTKFERPVLSPANYEPLRKNMVITLEPAAFCEGVGGIRLEQMVHITDSGARLLFDHSPENADSAFRALKSAFTGE